MTIDWTHLKAAVEAAAVVVGSGLGLNVLRLAGVTLNNLVTKIKWDWAEKAVESVVFEVEAMAAQSAKVWTGADKRAAAEQQLTSMGLGWAVPLIEKAVSVWNADLSAIADRLSPTPPPAPTPASVSIQEASPGAAQPA
jgi:hypothetical protein